MKEIAVLIVAAGNGSRFDKEKPKQYSFGILRRTIEKFIANPLISYVQVVINKADENLYDQSVKGLNLLPAVYGGKVRGESVKNGLLALKSEQPDIILVHDACRPYFSDKLLTRMIDELLANPGYGVIPVLPIVETVKKIEEDSFSDVNRDNLFTMQTPQGFYFKQLLDYYEKCKEFSTDESNSSSRIKFIDGERENLKITYKEDVKMEIATGIGFDAHRFENSPREDNFILLGGVKIPYPYKLEAHSDGDVAIHAIVDALLGALGEGDIGVYFPPSENKWKNADSKIFLQACREMLEKKNASINNIDITIICESPKVGAYREQIKQNLATILAIETDRINVKATTTEGMGFTGRKEGIAVQASACLKRLAF